MYRMLTLAAYCGLLACGSNPDEQPLDPENILADFEAAWEGRDLSALDACLSSDFFYVLPPEYWDDFDGDGTVDSGYAEGLYLQFAECAFDSSDSISLDLAGEGWEVWEGDSTGESVLMQRQFDLRIRYPDSSSVEQGTWDFLARPDGVGWIIFMMELQPDM